MSNNTKLIMETWRRFINEGEDPVDGQEPQVLEPAFESNVPVEEDPDMNEEVPFDPLTQTGEDEFELNVQSIIELLEEDPNMSDERLLDLKFTQDEIDKARRSYMPF